MDVNDVTVLLDRHHRRYEILRADTVCVYGKADTHFSFIQIADDNESVTYDGWKIVDLNDLEKII